jgi:hypothetical protein
MQNTSEPGNAVVTDEKAGQVSKLVLIHNASSQLIVKHSVEYSNLAIFRMERNKT